MANQGGLLSSEDINDGMITFLFSVTLHDIVHTDKSLTLVFEYLERDLKQYMDDCGAILSMNNVKLFLFQVQFFFEKYKNGPMIPFPGKRPNSQ